MSYRACSIRHILAGLARNHLITEKADEAAVPVTSKISGARSKLTRFLHGGCCEPCWVLAWRLRDGMEYVCRVFIWVWDVCQVLIPAWLNTVKVETGRLEEPTLTSLFRYPARALVHADFIHLESMGLPRVLGGGASQLLPLSS